MTARQIRPLMDIPVPIGTGTTAYLRVPRDLTREEAAKIARVVVTLPNDEKEARRS